MNVYSFVRQNGRSPFEEYLKSIQRDFGQLGAIQAVIEKLFLQNGRLPRPYAAHVDGKIWELRTRFGNRVFYFVQEGNNIILLDGYTKKRDRIEAHVRERVQHLYHEYQLTMNRKPYSTV